MTKNNREKKDLFEDFDNINFDDEKTEFLDNSEIAEKLKFESARDIKNNKVFRRFLSKQYNKVEKIDDLLGKLPEKHEQIRIITKRAFNAYALLLYIVEKFTIEECYLASYNIDKNTIAGLEMLLESENIKKLNVIISVSIAHRTPQRLQELKNVKKKYKERMNIYFAYNHTKIILCKTEKKHNFVIEGSGNLTDNARIEQYLFEDCEETYNFHKEWMDDILHSEYKNEGEIKL